MKKEIITINEQKQLLNWIFNNQSRFQKNDFGKNRKYLELNNIDVPNIFFEIKYRILKNENMLDSELDPIFGDMITWNSEGGFIHPHIDPTVPGKDHFRFNLFLSKPESGGNPIYNDKKLNFNEREYIKYHVNRYKHMSTPVVGSKPRIAISYGISVDSSLCYI